MPLYEYECTQCKKHTEKIQKFSDAEITECPHCGGKLERVVSAPAIAFKGGGWYADGYGNAKPKASGGGESSGDAGAGAKPAGDSATAASKDGGTAAAAPASTPAAAPAAAPAASASKSSAASDK